MDIEAEMFHTRERTFMAAIVFIIDYNDPLIITLINWESC